MSDSSPAGLEQRLGYRFRDRQLLLQALTHKSYANEHPEDASGHNERLEFLGDAVLDLVVSEEIFQAFPHLAEGEMTRVRAEIVSETSLSRLGRGLDLGECLRLGRGEDQTGGRNKDSLLADAVEAVFGAIFTDSDFPGVQQIILDLLGAELRQAAARKNGLDCKTRLQERVQASHGCVPRYALLDTSGPDHERLYRVAVSLQGVTIGCGSGRTKKQAEQEAACEALRTLEGP